MEKASHATQSETELTMFIRQVRENFQAAGQRKSGGWLSNLLKKLFG